LLLLVGSLNNDQAHSSLLSLNHYLIKEISMRLPARFAPIAFGGLLSLIMVTIVSAFVIASTRGLEANFMSQWARSCITTWPIAFPTVTLIAPWVRRVVLRLTEQSEQRA
jgi:hypothetical protein